MPFSFGKVIAVRLKRFTKNRRDHSIPAGISNAFPSPALASDSSPAHAVSARRESGLQVPTRGTSDAVQLSLSVLQAMAGPIPLAGGPIQAAINGLLATLQAINRHTQNKAAIASLKMRLYRLCQHLCNAPTARDHLEQLRRDALISVLEATSEQLTRLSKRFLVYQSVTQAITSCSSDLDQYLQEYSLSAQMQMQNVVVETRDILVQQFRGPTAMQPGTFTPGCFTLVDATGRERLIPVDFGTSYEQLKKLLETWFVSNTNETRIQRQYMEQGLYNLCIDMGTQVTTLESQHDRWLQIEAGMKIVMRVIFQVDMASSSAPYRCHSCGALNYSLQSIGIEGMHQGWTVSCRECKRRYQISVTSTRLGGRQAIAAMPLITHFDVREIPRAYHIRDDDAIAKLMDHHRHRAHRKARADALNEMSKQACYIPTSPWE